MHSSNQRSHDYKWPCPQEAGLVIFSDLTWARLTPETCVALVSALEPVFQAMTWYFYYSGHVWRDSVPKPVSRRADGSPPNSVRCSEERLEYWWPEKSCLLHQHGDWNASFTIIGAQDATLSSIMSHPLLECLPMTAQASIGFRAVEGECGLKFEPQRKRFRFRLPWWRSK